MITTRIIKVVYILYMVAIARAAVGFIVSAFAGSTAAGVVVLLIAAPLFALIYLVLSRQPLGQSSGPSQSAFGGVPSRHGARSTSLASGSPTTFR